MPKHNKEYYEGLLSNPNIKAYLLTIRKGEGTLGSGGYSIHFGGGTVETLSKNPVIGKTWTAGKYTSSAVGAFQFLNSIKHPTWPNIAARFGFKDFSPHNQDIGALSLIDEKGALPDIVSGNIVLAIEKTKGVWASLPGSKYGQPTQKLKDALSFYQKQGGNLEQRGLERTADNSLLPGIPGATRSLSASISQIVPPKKMVSMKSKNAQIAGEQQNQQTRYSLPNKTSDGLGAAYNNVAKVYNGSNRKLTDKVRLGNRGSELRNLQNLMLGKMFIASPGGRKVAHKFDVAEGQSDRQGRYFNPDSPQNKVPLNLPLQMENPWVAPKLLEERFFANPGLFGLPLPLSEPARKIQDTVEMGHMKDAVDSLGKKTQQLNVLDPIKQSGEEPGKAGQSDLEIFLPRGDRGRQSADSSQAAPQQMTKNVSIHLSKSLIDNFSVVVANASDGIGDLKSKVEEALLEVLNSANAI